MKNRMLILSLAAFVCLISCRESKEKVFERVAVQMTKKCPLVINEFTRLDSVIYLPNGNINQYYYTLLGNADDAQSIEANRGKMESVLINEISNSLDMREYKEYHTTMEYIYYSDKNQSELLRLKITPEQYK